MHKAGLGSRQLKDQQMDGLEAGHEVTHQENFYNEWEKHTKKRRLRTNFDLRCK